MKLKLIHLFFSAFALLNSFSEQNFLHAQTTRMVFGTTATYMNISGGTSGTPMYCVVGNPANNAIARTAGWITSEGEYNYVKWLNTTPVSYIIPFGYATAAYLPFTFSKTAGAAADITVSTWSSAIDNRIKAFGVTNMYSQIAGKDEDADGAPTIGVADGCCVIDRWWSITTAGATANVTFSYRGAENTTDATFGGPTGNFGAQRWNGTGWAAPIGSAVGVTAGVGSITANSISNFSPWVLSKLLAILPVEWLDLSAECVQEDVTIKWSTASEQNADYFTLERSLDGTNFSAIATNQAAGSSSTVNNYSAVDTDPYAGTSFYRVRETDFNGSYIFSSIITINGCSGNNVIIYGEDGGVSADIHALEDGSYNIEMLNVLGQKITAQFVNVTAGNNHIKLSSGNISSAIYVVKVYNSNNLVTKKVFASSNK